MYGNVRGQPTVPTPSTASSQPSPLGNAFYGEGSGLIRGGLGAYGAMPFMAFGTFVVLAGLSLGLGGKFSPEALSWQFVRGFLGWLAHVALLKFMLLTLGSGDVSLLDIVAYAGYAFIGISVACLGSLLSKYSYYILMPWTSLMMGVFLVKTMKRVLFAEVKSHDSRRHHYLLLFIAMFQFPIFGWFGSI